MTVLTHPVVGFAEQDVDEVTGAEALVALALEPHHRGQQLLGRHRAVPGLRWRQAGVTVATRRGGLPEIGQQLHPPALDRLAQGEHGVEVGGQVAAVGEIALALIDHAALLHDVLQAVSQPGRRGQAVAPGATRLLVVPLDRLRQVEVGDEPHVGLVDAHAERDGGDHHEALLAQEPALVAGAHPGVETRVVRQRGNAVLHEELGCLLHGCPRQAVHDARVSGVLGAQQREQLLQRLLLGLDAVLDIGPVEARHELFRLREVEALGDLLARGVGRRRRERDARNAGPALVQHRQLQVVGPEVVTPLRDAVRLVDREQRDRAAVEQVGGG